MCQCTEGDNPVTSLGQQQAGDIQVIVQYHASVKSGPISHRRYPRIGRGGLMWLDPRDQKVKPDWWRLTAEDLTPGVDEIRAIALEALSASP